MSAVESSESEGCGQPTIRADFFGLKEVFHPALHRGRITHEDQINANLTGRRFVFAKPAEDPESMSNGDVLPSNTTKLDDLAIKYGIWQLEELYGKFYLHGYVEFTRIKRIKAVRKILGDETWINIATKDSETHRAICSRTTSRVKGDFNGPWEVGLHSSKREANELEQIVALIESGKDIYDIRCENLKLWSKHYKFITHDYNLFHKRIVQRLQEQAASSSTPQLTMQDKGKEPEVGSAPSSPAADAEQESRAEEEAPETPAKTRKRSVPGYMRPTESSKKARGRKDPETQEAPE
jgi:hypothetical protein